MGPTIALQAATAAKDFFGNNWKWILPVVLLVLLYFFWGQYVIRRLLGNVPDDSPYLIGGGDITKAFHDAHKNKVDRLYKALKASSLSSDSRCSILTEANGFNNNQLILLHNSFKNKYGQTVYEMLSSVYGDDCFAFDFLNPWGLNFTLSEKLTGLGLV